MSTHKHINKICCVAVIFSLLITLIFMNAKQFGIQAAPSTLGYEERLFDTTSVHTIDIVMDDWDNYIETCENEEYTACTAVIDGEAFKNIGIRAKGNTSLSSVSQMDSDRYSFKIEFDQYDNTNTYYGLDKLSLNNLIQDNTFLKDYLTYQMMGEFGVDAPLCSYVYITVNGEDWGLYLAVEGVEDSFLQRNNGNDYGELYKPDSMSFGGGRGNGKDFHMENLDSENSSTEHANASDSSEVNTENADSESTPSETSSSQNQMQRPQMPNNGEMPQGMQAPNNGEMTQGMQMPNNGEMTQGMQMPNNGEMPENMQIPNNGEMPGNSGMGSSDVKLQYSDDNPDSYSNIFNNAKTDISAADQTRLIESLKTLSSGDDIESVVDIESVIRYFVVHNFVVNGDSYTGSMIHNYYLYEEDGLLSMIPWDYNLAYGTFQGSNASSAVNDPIDSPVSDGSIEDRPMIAWIFGNEEYTNLYHQYFADFIETYFDSGYFSEMIDSVTELIAPYVEKDPNKFCTYEDFEAGAQTIKEFCLLRAESVSGQLDGTIPSTSEGQTADSSSLVDASGITLSDMGTMGNTMGKGFQDKGNHGSGQSMMPKENMAENLPGFEQPAAYNSSTWILLGISTVVLLLGLLFAIRYKRVNN